MFRLLVLGLSDAFRSRASLEAELVALRAVKSPCSKVGLAGVGFVSPILSAPIRAPTLSRIVRDTLPRPLLILLAFLLLTVAVPRAADATDASARDTDRLHALLINGGGRPRINYHSHLLHLRQVRELLLASGVTDARISIFASDGDDPDQDVALRTGRPDENTDLWRLRGTRAWTAMTPPIVYESSTIDRTKLHPATQDSLTAWFEHAAGQLHAGDTLLIYVTDHGNENKEDRTDNTITLWGEDESLSVSELAALIDRLDPGVRVVLLMSQCYSGSFAHLVAKRAPAGRLVGTVCGYFSATADRRAYGCYPQNLGRDNVGHSFRFIHALADGRSLADAHLDVVETDTTPDVPVRTSDFYLEELLHQAAERDGKEYAALVDELLERAWRDKARLEPEIRFLDRIGKTFGYFSPRSLAELDEQITRLPDIAGQIQNVSRAWGDSLQDANQAHFLRFTEATPAWNERIRAAMPPPPPFDAKVVADNRKSVSAAPAKMLTDAERDALSKEFLDAFTTFTRADLQAERRILTLHDKSEDAGATSYRMEVRLAVVLRMRATLTGIAGRTYLETRGSDQERAAYRALRECEDLTLAPTRRPVMALADPEAFPPFEDDLQRATAALPGWMGIRFADVEEPLRKKYELGDGASRVVVVYPDSSAEKAGLESGDIVLGPPDHPFQERRQIRAWTMLSEIGQPRPLKVLREGETLELTLVPGPFPLKWPELPGPPEVGQTAPPVELSTYRGDLQHALAGGPHLLFFWATWCAPCKASIPELLELEKTLDVPVIAITDEIPEQLDTFFKERDEFPAIVAIDRQRKSFLAYGVSGTPTFVYVDENGRVADYSSGYSKEKGLGAEIQKLMRQAKK